MPISPIYFNQVNEMCVCNIKWLKKSCEIKTLYLTKYCYKILWCWRCYEGCSRFGEEILVPAKVLLWLAILVPHCLVIVVVNLRLLAWIICFFVVPTLWRWVSFVCIWCCFQLSNSCINKPIVVFVPDKVQMIEIVYRHQDGVSVLQLLYNVIEQLLKMKILRRTFSKLLKNDRPTSLSIYMSDPP